MKQRGLESDKHDSEKVKFAKFRIDNYNFYEYLKLLTVLFLCASIMSSIFWTQKCCLFDKRMKLWLKFLIFFLKIYKKFKIFSSLNSESKPVFTAGSSGSESGNMFPRESVSYIYYTHIHNAGLPHFVNCKKKDVNKCFQQATDYVLLTPDYINSEEKRASGFAAINSIT